MGLHRKDNHRHELESLEKKDAQKTEFFMAASHQLKSPLAIILWCLQSTLESPHLSGKDRDMILKAVGQAGAMSQLIGDMLHVFRLVNRRGKSQDYEAVDCNELIAAILTDYEVVAHKKKVHLVKGPMEVLPTVFADKAYLRQAIINLVDNAIKYSVSGTTVTVTTSVKEGWATISIHDHGIGMTEADQQKLFSEFFRSEEARQVAHEGTGLGLVLVKHIIEEFGGKVTVESVLHKGSTFTIKLPIPK
ncbi:MAG: putative Histidine kinase [Patescibacteria group bacterium]|jgi:two-component system phosphate regulon sensor histidine kinase PhoR|nr:putative Histidine kinase [Patescibacteria group bacterium]